MTTHTLAYYPLGRQILDLSSTHEEWVGLEPTQLLPLIQQYDKRLVRTILLLADYVHPSRIRHLRPVSKHRYWLWVVDYTAALTTLLPAIVPQETLA